ncbi:hypothetical protein KIPB_004920, partial [Kipferlia bialata]
TTLKRARASGKLDMSGSDLTNVEFLRDFNTTTFEDQKWFELVPLRQLILRHNEIQMLPEWVPEGLAEALEELVVPHNALTALPTSLPSLTLLRRLEVQHNSISGRMCSPDVFLNMHNLVYIDLSHNPSMSSLPDSISDLSSMEVLIASHCGLRTLPASFGPRLQRLRRCDISHNSLTEFTPHLASLIGLETLDMSHNKLETLFDVKSLSHCVDIDVSFNSISEIPRDAFGYMGLSNDTPSSPTRSNRTYPLQGLTRLVLSNNRLTSLPESLFACVPMLETLLCSDNSIKSLPEHALAVGAPHSRLKTLDLACNDLTTLPGELGLVTSITRLLADGNPFRSFRRSVLDRGTAGVLSYLRSRLPVGHPGLAQAEGKGGILDQEEDKDAASRIADASRGAMDLVPDVHNLRTISRQQSDVCLSGMKLDRVPYELTSTPALYTLLAELDLSHNRLDSAGLSPLTSSLGLFTALRTLDLSHNHLSSVDNGIGDSPGLTVLSLSHNRLGTLPSSLAHIHSLVTLDLSYNKFTDAALSGIDYQGLGDLQTLNLSHNSLTSLPDCLTRLAKLRVLDASGNRIVSIMSKPHRLVKLEELILENNDISDLPPTLGLLSPDADAPYGGVLRHLKLNGNPLRRLGQRVAARGTTHILEYLRHKIRAGTLTSLREEDGQSDNGKEREKERERETSRARPAERLVVIDSGRERERESSRGSGQSSPYSPDQWHKRGGERERERYSEKDRERDRYSQRERERERATVGSRDDYHSRDTRRERERDRDPYSRERSNTDYRRETESYSRGGDRERERERDRYGDRRVSEPYPEQRRDRGRERERDPYRDERGRDRDRDYYRDERREDRGRDRDQYRDERREREREMPRERSRPSLSSSQHLPQTDSDGRRHSAAAPVSPIQADPRKYSHNYTHRLW